MAAGAADHAAVEGVEHEGGVEGVLGLVADGAYEEAATSMAALMPLPETSPMTRRRAPSGLVRVW